MCKTPTLVLSLILAFCPGKCNTLESIHQIDKDNVSIVLYCLHIVSVFIHGTYWLEKNNSGSIAFIML